jgi:hypothetical protein
MLDNAQVMKDVFTGSLGSWRNILMPVLPILCRMVDELEQARMMEKVEALFNRYGKKNIPGIEKSLKDLGFVQKDADPAVIRMERADYELGLVVELDGKGHIHGYELLPFKEWNKKQEKFRW